MYCVRKVLEDLWWVGGNDRRLAMFEGVYAVPNGVSYNSYLLLDDKTVLFDTVDPSVSKVFFENVDHVLAGRKLDYLVIHHMEPDHSGTVSEVLLRHPETVIVCSDRIRAMLQQFRGGVAPQNAFHLVKEGDTFETGHHTLTFLSAPMVHWPEVMVSYDLTTRTLFSADAFGTFGAINGALFADEVDFFRDYVDEARRYYCNIVGKYGTQVQALLKKASTVQIDRICPLHGFVWRKNIGEFIDRYVHWSTYTPEEQGVMIAYASVYGGTENAAELLSVRLRERGVKTVMFDVSVTPASDIIAAAFRWSHLVFAAPTYNAGIFVTMENLLHDIVAHNLQNRTVALIENGSWAPTSGKHDARPARQAEECHHPRPAADAPLRHGREPERAAGRAGRRPVRHAAAAAGARLRTRHGGQSGDVRPVLWPVRSERPARGNATTPASSTRPRRSRIRPSASPSRSTSRT